MKKEILTIKEVLGAAPAMTLRIDTYPEGAGRKDRALADTRVAQIVDLLVRGCGVPRKSIKTVIGQIRSGSPTVRISVATVQSGKGS